MFLHLHLKQKGEMVRFMLTIKIKIFSFLRMTLNNKLKHCKRGRWRKKGRSFTFQNFFLAF